MKKRCLWATEKDATYIKYHDSEWGVPVIDDNVLFEFLVLESAQAGLSWSTILKKRNGYRKAFKGFSVEKVSKMSEKEITELFSDPTIVRNKLKIKSTVSNAQVFIDIQNEYGSFSNYIWEWVHNKPIQNYYKYQASVPTVTPLATEIATDLKKQGIKFFGPTICYAYMQATGITNDHTVDCFRYTEILEMGKTQ